MYVKNNFILYRDLVVAMASGNNDNNNTNTNNNSSNNSNNSTGNTNGVISSVNRITLNSELVKNSQV